MTIAPFFRYWYNARGAGFIAMAGEMRANEAGPAVLAEPILNARARGKGENANCYSWTAGDGVAQQHRPGWSSAKANDSSERDLVMQSGSARIGEADALGWTELSKDCYGHN